MLTASCSSSSSPSPDANDDQEANTCIFDAGTFTCFGKTWPVCGVSVDPAGVEVSGACASGTPSCIYCNENAGNACNCQSDGDGGFEWLCVGTEYPCR